MRMLLAELAGGGEHCACAKPPPLKWRRARVVDIGLLPVVRGGVAGKGVGPKLNCRALRVGQPGRKMRAHSCLPLYPARWCAPLEFECTRAHLLGCGEGEEDGFKGYVYTYSRCSRAVGISK